MLPRVISKYSEDEPRDDSGKWTDGGGDDGSPSEDKPQSPATGGGISLDQAKAAVAKVSAALEHKGQINLLETEPPTFELNGEHHTYAGAAYRPGGEKAGQIDVWVKNTTPEHIEGLLAHEIQHQKYNTALSAYQADLKQIMELPRTPGAIDDVMRPDGLLKPPYDQQFPNYQDILKARYMPDAASWKVGDGVSGYSLDWWKAEDEKTAGHESAIHETLAEMSAAKYTTGNFPEHRGFDLLRFRKNSDGTFKPKPTAKERAVLTKQWRDLYRAVDRVNKRVAGK